MKCLQICLSIQASHSCSRLLQELFLMRYHNRAFTLIELLVVISIIAVLLSLLLPTMKEARRHVQVLTCTSRLHQMGIGLMIYALEQNNKYPEQVAINPGYIWLDVYPIDTREILKQIANGQGAEIYFCPVNTQPKPNKPETWGMWNYTPHPSPYQDQFITHPDNQRHTVDYMMWFMTASTFVWNNSGNPDINGDGISDPPIRPGDSDAAVVTDGAATNTAWGDTVAGTSLSAHTGNIVGVPFRESNVLYGDGHVETHGTPEHWVNRSGETWMGVY